MNDAPGMRRRKRVGDLNRNRKRAFQLQGAPVDDLADVASLDVLHGDEMNACGLVQIKDSAYVRVVQTGSKPGFARKALQAGFIGGQVRRKDLDYNRAPEPGIDSFIDLPHPARAELLTNLVMGERLRDHCRLTSRFRKKFTLTPLCLFFNMG